MKRQDSAPQQHHKNKILNEKKTLHRKKRHHQNLPDVAERPHIDISEHLRPGPPRKAVLVVDQGGVGGVGVGGVDVGHAVHPHERQAAGQSARKAKNYCLCLEKQ